MPNTLAGLLVTLEPPSHGAGTAMTTASSLGPRGWTVRPPVRAILADLLRFGPLQRRLFVIVFVGLLPLAILAFATLVYTANAQRNQIIAATDNTVRAILTAVDMEIGVSWAALDALAASPRLARNDWAAFHAESVEFLSRRPGWANIVLSTPNAQQLVNARIPFGNALPSRIDPSNVESVARTGTPQVGKLVLSPIFNEYAFAAAVPVLREGRVAYVLIAPVRPDAIRDVVSRQAIPDQGVVAVLDTHRRVLARSRQHDDSIGKEATADLQDLLDAQPDGGWGISRTLEGRSVYTVFRRSGVTGWTVAIGIPTTALDGPVARSYAALGGAIVLSVVLGLVVALFTALWVTRPMQELELAAAAVAAGESPREPRTDLPEVRKVASALALAHVEREKLLQSEREARLVAENASHAKDQFLAMLGHELRNPVAAISTAAQILDRVEPGSVYATEGAAIIRRQALHLGRMTEDLLDAGRVMLGKITLKRSAVELAGLVDHVVTTLRSTGQLSLHRVNVATVPAWVDADATRLEQVIGNLVGNAVKYTGAGKSIDISVESRGALALLRVRDQGIGIDAELLPRVFDLFVQGRQSADRAEGGLGVGLALVRRLVELHGGAIEAHSEGPGEGSEFVVMLPRIDAPPNEPRPHAEPITRPKRIVLVEDNEDARVTLRRVLELDGHEVHEAPDGRTGLDKILELRPDVAVVDIGLPGLDGYAVARTVREQMQASIRLIALTGYGQPEDSERGRKAGFDEYLVKPAHPDTLRKALHA